MPGSGADRGRRRRPRGQSRSRWARRWASAQGKIQSPLDAIYWLDYKRATLYAAIPASRQTAQEVALLREFAERDLVADFALRPGDNPRFLLQTASLGGLGGGSSVLLVIETATKQVGAYQARPRSGILDPRPEFERLQLLSYAQPAPTSARPRRDGPRASRSSWPGRS